LGAYIDACGVEYVHARVDVLPGHVITSLSALCAEVSDDVAHVLGGHDHLDALVLNASPRDIYACEDGEGRNDKDNDGRLTIDGLLSMMHPMNMTLQSEEGLLLEPPKNSIIDSWEGDQDSYFIVQEPRCNLRRLQLRNFHAESASDVIQFLRRCPKLTHLSLGKSLNAITGSQVLLWDEQRDTLGESKSRTMLDVLPNLQFLDLSGCTWLNFDLLKSFLKRIIRQIFHAPTRVSGQKICSPIALEMICVGGCCKYLSEQCTILNELTGQKPMVCIRQV